MAPSTSASSFPSDDAPRSISSRRPLTSRAPPSHAFPSDRQRRRLDGIRDRSQWNDEESDAPSERSHLATKHSDWSKSTSRSSCEPHATTPARSAPTPPTQPAGEQTPQPSTPRDAIDEDDEDDEADEPISFPPLSIPDEQRQQAIDRRQQELDEADDPSSVSNKVLPGLQAVIHLRNEHRRLKHQEQRYMSSMTTQAKRIDSKNEQWLRQFT